MLIKPMLFTVKDVAPFIISHGQAQLDGVCNLYYCTFIVYTADDLPFTRFFYDYISMCQMICGSCKSCPVYSSQLFRC
jgi:hypothetical protein